MDTITFIFGGDFAPCRRFEPLAIAEGPALFGDLQDTVSQADVAFLNLETPLCNPHSKISKSGPALRASPDCIEPVRSAGFNIVGLANNHIMDYGEEGLTSTLETCEAAGLSHVGAGKNLADAETPTVIDVRGKKIAIVAVAEREFSIAENALPGAAPLDVISNLQQIEKAKQLGDLVVMTIHGGNEYFSYPRPGLRRQCKFYIQHGVDVIVCHHPHIAGPYEVIDDRPIFYSMGNLIFDHASPAPEGWEEGYLVKLSVDISTDQIEKIAFEIIPYHQSVSARGIAKLHGPPKDNFLNRIDHLNSTLADETSWLQEWNKFTESRARGLIFSNYLPIIPKGLALIARFIPLTKWILPHRSVQKRLNMVRCQSHLEVLTNLLRLRS